ncbi:hypothetical protein DFH08DRAFT_958464 [Mycena albidolilacea]|uniref:Uncharacterized protein n=1 Tax=Mycena albidolilacea TaxID=1033008 RepID=A0AAD7EV55_9AGAR|nr:hypothetical protein DFH08DRAFT_958464 [Mycena albidolilacea]
MEDFYPTYSDTSKHGKTREIWTKAFVRYWADFPWRLPLTQDPNPDDPTDYGLAPQTPEEEAEHKKVIITIEAVSRVTSQAGLKSNPWAEWLTHFRTPVGPVPKKQADFQYYMWLDEYKGKVAEQFEAMKGDAPAAEHMNIRAQAACELLALETPEMNKHEDMLEGLLALDEEDLDEARSRFSSLVGPLLEGLAGHTGYEISIFAGRVIKDEGRINIESVSLHAGATAETPVMLDFSRADANVYGEVMKKFSRFVRNAHEFREGGSGTKEGTTPSSSTVAPPSPSSMAPPATISSVSPPPTNLTAPIPPNPALLQDSFSDPEI